MSKHTPYTRHNEMPSLLSSQGQVKALYYNHVQTALKRLNEKLRYSIPKLKNLDLILQKDAWIVVDTMLNDMPVIAWTQFQVEHRESLHQAVSCEIRFFHYAADMILDRTLEAMELLLGEELADSLPENLSNIISFNKDKS